MLLDYFNFNKRCVVIGRAIRMREAGYSVKEIAEALGIKECEVRKIEEYNEKRKANKEPK